MQRLTYRNSQGDLVDIAPIAADKSNLEFSEVLKQAQRFGVVAITQHDSPKAIVMSYDEFEKLVRARSRALEMLDADLDAKVIRMQTPRAKKAVRSLFNATPAQLGRAAVKAAK